MNNEALPELPLTDLKPYFSITVLECVGDDPRAAFASLRLFLRATAGDRGRAESCRVWAEATKLAEDAVGPLGTLRELGFDELYGVAREVVRSPGWVIAESGVVDLHNQLTVAVRKNRLVAVCTGITSESQLRSWVYRNTDFRFLPVETLAGTFDGDGRMIWMRGVRRPWATRPSNKALTGLRLQDALNPLEDNNFALSAGKFWYLPEDGAAVLRELVTVSPDKSKISWKQTTDFLMFLVAASEALDLLEKKLVSVTKPEPVIGGLAVPETDLTKVSFAVDAAVTDPDQVRGGVDAREEEIHQASVLAAATLDVRGFPHSPVAELDVVASGEKATFTLIPVQTHSGFRFDVRHGDSALNPELMQVKDTMGAGGLLTLYYGSGHIFDGCHIYWRNLVSTPFPNIEFADFEGYEITQEKPAVKGNRRIHEGIGIDGDKSLFAWVVQHYQTGWLLCDDGAGEIADFLHLAADGSLTAIHVKGAASDSPGRRIAVTGFEQLVSQAEKNVTLLSKQTLIDKLTKRNNTPRPAWHNGNLIAPDRFIDQLRIRREDTSTTVVIIQPHLAEAAYRRARAAIGSGKETQDTHFLRRLDNLLHSTRTTITGQCTDPRVIGSK